jgi:hypothetical protein
MIPFQIAYGRKPHDPQRLAAVPRHVMGTTAPAPVTLPRPQLVWAPSLVQNDTLPTCTVAGALNAARVWALLQGFDLASVEANLLGVFATVAGCEPTAAAIGATDGLVMLDLLEHLVAVGLDVGEQVPIGVTFTAIDHTDLAAIRDAIATADTAYVGVDLYEADVQPGATWQGGVGGAGKVVGGHCVCLPRYRPGSVTAATWGLEEDADDAWLASRIVEAYALRITRPVAVG